MICILSMVVEIRLFYSSQSLITFHIVRSSFQVSKRFKIQRSCRAQVFQRERMSWLPENKRVHIRLPRQMTRKVVARSVLLEKMDVLDVKLPYTHTNYYFFSCLLLLGKRVGQSFSLVQRVLQQQQCIKEAHYSIRIFPGIRRSRYQSFQVEENKV